MDRRAFLTRLSAAALGGLLLPRAAMAPAAYADGDRLRDLPEVRSTNGLLDHRLDMAAAQVRLRDRVLTLDTYNGGLPGPILRVRPGDRMRILLRNLMRPMGIPLNKLPPLCASHPGDTVGTTGHPHGTVDCVASAAGNMLHGHTLPQVMIATNIHTHGLQVSPEGSADNVFVRVDPLGSHQYSYDIPADHPAGLHWYHPHFHGSTRAGPACPARSSSKATSTPFPRSPPCANASWSPTNSGSATTVASALAKSPPRW